MARFEFNIPELYRATFGYIGLPFPAGDLSIHAPNVSAIGKAIIGKSDHFGNPYFMPIRLNGVWLPNSPTLSISGSKDIKCKKNAGGNGTIKELISIDDYELQIRGFCINHEDDDYPYDEVEAIKELWEQNKAIQIYNDLCEIYGINNVVVRNHNLPEQIYQNVQAFEMSLVSDFDFEVILEDNYV